MLRTTTLLPVLALTATLALSGCQNVFGNLENKANVPVPKQLISRMKAKDMPFGSAIMVRVFKEENVLEIWKQRRNGRFALLDSHEICKWSGKLGPKFKEGDRQAPEGFYTVRKHQMNPRSKYHLAFNIGFPNAYDKAHGRTGTHLMVHGACSSAGCYSMTDERVEVIYALARESFKGGNKSFQFQAFPFRLTTENMIKHRDHKHFKFWQMLKKGYDQFQITSVPPKVDVCERRYEFNTSSKGRFVARGQCPARTMPASLATAFLKKQTDYRSALEKALENDGKSDAALTPVTLETLLPGVTVKLPKPVESKATTASIETSG